MREHADAGHGDSGMEGKRTNVYCDLHLHRNKHPSIRSDQIRSHVLKRNFDDKFTFIKSIDHIKFIWNKNSEGTASCNIKHNAKIWICICVSCSVITLATNMINWQLTTHCRPMERYLYEVQTNCDALSAIKNSKIKFFFSFLIFLVIS